MSRSAAFTVVVTMTAFCPLVCAETVVIQLKEQVEVAANVVRLSDVAHIQAPFRTLYGLRSIDVADMTLAEELSISRQRLSLRLQLEGYAPEQFRITGAAECVIRTEKAEPLETRVVQLLTAEYAELFGVDEDQLRVTLLCHLNPPANDSLMQLTLASRPVAKLGLSLVYVNMHSVRHDSRHNQVVKHRVERLGPVPVIGKPLRRGDVIQAQHVDWKEQFIADAPLTLENLLHQTVVRDYEAGERLNRNDLVDPQEVKLVESGARVTAFVKVGPLMVTLDDALALNAGARGQQIQIRHPNNSIFTAVVIGKNQVRSLLHGQSADREGQPVSQLRGAYGYSGNEEQDSFVQRGADLSGNHPTIDPPKAPKLLNPRRDIQRTAWESQDDLDARRANAIRSPRSRFGDTDRRSQVGRTLYEERVAPRSNVIRKSISDSPNPHGQPAARNTPSTEREGFASRLMQRLRTGRPSTEQPY